jgi:hypothetical protein
MKAGRSFLLLLFIVSASIIVVSGCKVEDDPVSAQEDHFQPEGLVVLTSAYDTVAYYFQGVVRIGDTLKAPTGNTLSPHWTIEFLDASRKKLAYPSTATHKLGWTIADQSIAQMFRHDGDEYEFHLRGLAEGKTTITFKILHGDHADFTSKPVPVLVDANVHGEAAGMRIDDEESGTTLVNVPVGATSATGVLTVRKDSLTDHAVVYFLDDTGKEFQPEVPPHGLGFTIADTTVAAIIPAGVDEPWAFQVRGKKAGTTTVVFKLLADGIAEWSTPFVTITVAP